MAASARQTYLKFLEGEYERSLRILRAFPDDKLDLKPHDRSKSARDVAWLLVMGHGLLEKAVTIGFDWSVPPQKMPDPPKTVAEMAAAMEQQYARLRTAVEQASEERLAGTVQFFTGPKQVGDVPLMDFLWFILFDHIHHRGQLSVYLRMAGAKVPSIYGPSADEPWM